METHDFVKPRGKLRLYTTFREYLALVEWRERNLARKRAGFQSVPPLQDDGRRIARSRKYDGIV